VNPSQTHRTYEEGTPRRSNFEYRRELEPHHRRHSECREDECEEHRHCEPERPWGPDRYWGPERYCGPTLFDLAVAKRYQLGTILLTGASWLQRPSFPSLCSIGFRLSEAGLLTQALKQSFWRTARWEDPYRWGGERYWPEREERRCRECGCREEECRCGHREERKCHHCGCREEECRCGHREERRCHRCGCREEDCRCGQRGSTDIRVEARKGDVRDKVILVENNSPRDVDIVLEADPWMDSTGASHPTTITFDHAGLHLAPGEAREFTATIAVTDPPLTSGVSYFTRIHLKGSGAKPISVELCVEPLNRIDFYAQTDPCRPRRGRFVDYCHESHERHCEERSERHHHRRCEPGFEGRGGHDPWAWQWDPWRWTGPDPYRFWYGLGRWQRFWLPPEPGLRCC
jgi:hypothetical protein